MNELYIVIIISILFSTLIIKNSDAFVLKQFSFININRKNKRINLTIKEIEDTLSNFNNTKLPLPVPIETVPLFETLTGNDMHITEDFQKEYENLQKIIKDNKRMEILKLLESSVSIDEKIDMIDNYPDFFRYPRDGGLMKKWIDDELFDDIE
jgi:hypothetical protein